MICDSCINCKRCPTPEGERVRLTWCPRYRYSSQMEKESERLNAVSNGRYK